MLKGIVKEVEYYGVCLVISSRVYAILRRFYNVKFSPFKVMAYTYEDGGYYYEVSCHFTARAAEKGLQKAKKTGLYNAFIDEDIEAYINERY
jgi:hypothetical protein